MGRKKSKTKQKQLGITSGPDTTSKQPPHGLSQEDEASGISSSNQSEVAGSVKHGGETDDSVFPYENETKSPRLTRDENTLQHWQNEIDDLSVPEIILLLKSDSPMPPEGQHEGLSTESAPKVFPRRSNQRKLAEHQKLVQGSIKISQVREYWNALSDEKKQSFLEVNIQDLWEHHAARRRELAGELLTEALTFAEINKKWAFWICFTCGEIFTDKESHGKHVWLHIGNLTPKLLLQFPKEVEHSRAEILVNACWKPFDLRAVVAILRGQRLFHSPTGIGSSDVGIHADGSNNGHFSEKSVQAVDVDSDAGIVQNEAWVDSSNSRSDLVVGDEKQDEADPIDKAWPLTDDPERSELLEKIRAGFLRLLRLRCLCSKHMGMFINLAMDSLRKIVPGFEPLDYGLDKTHACIFLLDAPSLRVLLWIFEKLNHAAVDLKSTADDHYACSVEAPVSDALKGISLSDDLCHLILNKFLSKAGTISTAENATQSECGTASVHPNDGVVGGEDFISWIYTSSPTGEELQSWAYVRKEKRHQGAEILKDLRKFFVEIQNLLTDSWKTMCYSNAFHLACTYCYKQYSERCSDTENIPPSLEDILRKRQEELAEDSLEREVIALVLKEAQASDATEIVHGEIPHSSDLLTCLDDVSCTEDSLNKANKSIVLGFERQDMMFLYEMSVIDVRIRQRIAVMRQLKCKLAAISAFDYLEIIFFLVKTFLREHLEGLAYKEAEMKSDAAWEGLLAELELDEKKSSKKGQNNSKQTKEKRNKRKKKKDRSRAKDSKDTGDESVPAYQENAEQDALLYATNTQVNPKKEIVVTENTHDWKQLEKEFWNIELEAEESLDYPWQMVTTVKHKKIGDKYEKGSRTFMDKAKVTKESPTDAASDTGYQHQSKELQQREKNIGLTLTFGSLPPEAIDGCGFPNDSTCQHAMSVEKNPAPVDEHPGDSNKKALEQPGDEEHDDERFQADLKRAIQESIDSFILQKDLPIEKISTNSSEDSRDSHNIVEANIEWRSDAPGTNDAGSNCLFDVIIQTLWRIRRFREEFSRTSKSLHLHVGDPCVVCALYDVFMALNKASTESQRNTVSLIDLKTSLSKFYDKVESLQSEQMNDAVEVLNAIFICLHQSITSAIGLKENEANSWDCSSKNCMAHHLFGMDILKIITCDGCPMEARCHKYTTFVRFIKANDLQKIQIKSSGAPLDALLKHVKINNKNTCDPERGGCGKRNYICHFQARAPHVFIAVVEQSTLENADDSSSALAAVDTEIDIGVISCCLGQGSSYRLISVICCNKQQLYSFFSYSFELKLWVKYGNTTMKAIESWDGLLAMMKREKLQPLVLIFECKSSRYLKKKPALLPVR